MARHLRASSLEPGIVLCSTSTRTRETLKLIRPAFRNNPRIRFLRSLYLAEWKVMLAAIRKTPVGTGTVLLVGHNPGMEELALALTKPPRTEAGRRHVRRLRKKFPTAALAVLDFDATAWTGILPQRGRLLAFVRPKDLSSGKGDET